MIEIRIIASQAQAKSTFAVQVSMAGALIATGAGQHRHHFSRKRGGSVGLGEECSFGLKIAISNRKVRGARLDGTNFWGGWTGDGRVMNLDRHFLGTGDIDNGSIGVAVLD